MRPGRWARARVAVGVAVLVSTALALAGCTVPTNPRATSSPVTIATSAPLTSSNVQSVEGNLQTNITVGSLTSSWFNYYDSTPRLVANTDFGTETALSTSPLTVRYTIKPGVTWSDGTPVGAADLLLDWAASISSNNSANGVDFTSAHAGGGLDLVTSVPTVSSNGRSMTVVYSKPFADWETALPSGMLPAHAVYALAFPGTRATAANRAVVAAISAGDAKTMTALAKAWSTGFAVTATPKNRSLILSDGPYLVSSIARDESITLRPNPRFRWGPSPRIPKLTLRVIQDPHSQVQAVQNGTVNLVTGLSGLTLSTVKTSGVDAAGSGTGNYEHIDLTFTNDGPFDKRRYRGSAARALAVREAFLKALPRSQLLTEIVHPIAPQEQLDDSQVLPPGADGYATSVAGNGSSAYDSVDIPGAKALLAGAGVKSIRVRLLFAKSNPARAQEVALITTSEALAGITVVPEANDAWPTLLGSGSYDAVLYAWDFTSLDVTANSPIFQTGGSKNFNGYSDAATDSNLAMLAEEFDHERQRALLALVDRAAWANAYGATLYEVPETTAWTSSMRGIADSPFAPGAFWNASKWSNARDSG